jgi:TPR repeat protein
VIEFDINPPTLVLLSKILNRSPLLVQRHLARRIMLSASRLGNEEATINLVTSGIRSGNFRNHRHLLERLEIMAKEGNPRAMTLLGRISANQGRKREALAWFRKATQGLAGLDFEEAGEALVCEAQLVMDDNAKEAETLFRKAAFELDDPSAYYYLSELQESPLNQVAYLMKAASSGIVEAAHKLGLMELSKTGRGADGNSPTSYGMAREWFQLAAAGKYGPSMLSLAQMCRECGELDEGLRWLNQAKKLEDVREQALKIESSWEEQERDLRY